MLVLIPELPWMFKLFRMLELAEVQAHQRSKNLERQGQQSSHRRVDDEQCLSFEAGRMVIVILDEACICAGCRLLQGLLHQIWHRYRSWNVPQMCLLCRSIGLDATRLAASQETSLTLSWEMLGSRDICKKVENFKSLTFQAKHWMTLVTGLKQTRLKARNNAGEYCWTLFW